MQLLFMQQYTTSYMHCCSYLCTSLICWNPNSFIPKWPNLDNTDLKPLLGKAWWDIYIHDCRKWFKVTVVQSIAPVLINLYTGSQNWKDTKWMDSSVASIPKSPLLILPFIIFSYLSISLAPGPGGRRETFLSSYTTIILWIRYWRGIMYCLVFEIW